MHHATTCETIVWKLHKNLQHVTATTTWPPPLSNAHEIWIQIELKHHKRPSRSALTPTVTLPLPPSHLPPWGRELPHSLSFSPCRLANFVTLNKHLVNNDMQNSETKTLSQPAVGNASHHHLEVDFVAVSVAVHPEIRPKKPKIRSTFSLDNNFYCWTFHLSITNWQQQQQQ